jgi:hypothetical protein
MKEITLQIPDNKFTFFMELVSSLDFIEAVEPKSSTEELSKVAWQEETLSEDEKNMLLKRISQHESNPETISWEALEKEIQLKYPFGA